MKKMKKLKKREDEEGEEGEGGREGEEGEECEEDEEVEEVEEGEEGEDEDDNSFQILVFYLADIRIYSIISRKVTFKIQSIVHSQFSRFAVSSFRHSIHFYLFFVKEI